MNMKILLIDETYPPDRRGSVPYAMDLAKYVRGRGDEADILTVGESKHLEIEQVTNGCVYRMPRHAEFDSARLSAALPWFLLKNIDYYDIVHLNRPNPIGELAFLLCKGTWRGRHTASVVTFHAEVVSTKRFARLYNAIITNPVMQLADKIIVSSPQMASTVACLSTVQEKTTVIPFGINLHAWQSCSKPQLPEQLMTINNGQLHLLFVGRLVRYKGIDVLVKAMTTAPGLLYIAGDGPLRESIDSLIKTLGLTERVKILGRVSDDLLSSLYTWADVLILPSVDRGEAFGYVLIEAMAHSTALISTELGTGTSWINIHGETGLVVPPRDSGILAGAIHTIAAQPDLLAQYKRNALRRAEEKFTLARMLTDTYCLYESLLKRRSVNTGKSKLQGPVPDSRRHP